jgi:tRNA(Ile)-lysidine synthase
MLKLLFPLPKQVTVALSGGVDSVAITDFLSRKHDVTCAFYHHGTENSERAAEFVGKFCTQRGLPLIIGMLNKEKDPKLSMEEFWRNERYNFLSSLSSLGPVITGHHLDDCVETYLHSAITGTPKVIPSTRNNVVRPFLTTRKSEFVSWCERKNITWCQDLSNDDTSYTRNYIRKELMPHALKVNPGLHSMVQKIVERKQVDVDFAE